MSRGHVYPLNIPQPPAAPLPDVQYLFSLPNAVALVCSLSREHFEVKVVRDESNLNFGGVSLRRHLVQSEVSSSAVRGALKCSLRCHEAQSKVIYLVTWCRCRVTDSLWCGGAVDEGPFWPWPGPADSRAQKFLWSRADQFCASVGAE